MKDKFKGIILMTDGGQSFALDQTPLPEAVKALEDKDIHRFAIGIGQEVARPELRLIAGDDVLVASDYEYLLTNIDQTIEGLATRGCRGTFCKTAKLCK